MNIRVLVDMSVALLHHGHIRLLKKAAEYGEVVVGLSTDKDIEKYKGRKPQLTWEFRKEIIESIRYVSEVVEVPYIITDAVLDEHDVQFLIHGDDNFNTVKKSRAIIFPRNGSHFLNGTYSPKGTRWVLSYFPMVLVCGLIK